MAKTHTAVYHTVIIGAGASGLMCAGSFSIPKLIIDHNPKPGAKVAVSGGGKCNFSNINLSAKYYLSAQKHFCKNALAAYKNTDFINLLEENHIPWTQTPSGQLFARRAQDIVTLLTRRAQQAHTDFWLNTQVLRIQPARQGLYTVQTSRGNIQARHVVLATGGLSFPALGVCAFGFTAARQLGLTVIEPQPALVGLVFPPLWQSRCHLLAGNSLPVQITCGKFHTAGPLLFTHEGVSGPAVLQTSLFWQEGETVHINFLPDTDVLAFLRRNKQSPALFSALLADKIPVKIAKALLGENNVPAANATAEQLQQAAQNLNHFSFVPPATAGWTKAEATKGGVDCREINPSTLQCRRLPGLFVIGELLDVTGLVGGYNLQWAWSSGWAAAKELEKLA